MARRSGDYFLVGDKATNAFVLTVLSVFTEAVSMQAMSFEKFLSQDPEDLINIVLTLLNTHVNSPILSEREEAAKQLVALMPLVTAKLAYAISPTYYDHFQRMLGAPARQDRIPGL
jgi:hypothetical protein